MAMQQVGTVAQLWRYPVKSFQGEEVERLAIGPGGAAGDRTLAVVDPAAPRGAVGQALPGPPHGLGAPGRGRHPAHAARRQRARGGRPHGARHALGLARHGGAPRGTASRCRLPHGDAHGHVRRRHTDLRLAGPAGTWLDLADAHWLTTASLAAAAALHPDGVWDVRRFRPTALVEVTESGWVEDGWSTVDVGAVGSEVLMPTPRCTMPSRAQPGFPVDRAIGTTIRDLHDNNLGVYASVTRAGSVTVGDAVCTLA